MQSISKEFNTTYNLNILIRLIKLLNKDIIFTLLKHQIYDIFYKSIFNFNVKIQRYQYERFFIADSIDTYNDIGFRQNTLMKSHNTLPRCIFYNCKLLPNVDISTDDTLHVFSMYFNYINCKIFYDKKSVTLTF